MLDHTPKACGSLGHGKRSPQKKADMTHQTEAPLNNKPRCGLPSHYLQHRHPLPWARISHATANLLPPPSFLR